MKPVYSILSAAAAAVAALIRMTLGDDGTVWVDPDAMTPVPPITAKAVEKLAYVGGTNTDIADRFLVDEQWVAREYANALRVARALHRLSLRGWQFDLARKLNNPMLNWLGRNVLGQTNQVAGADEEIPETHDDAGSGSTDK